MLCHNRACETPIEGKQDCKHECDKYGKVFCESAKKYIHSEHTGKEFYDWHHILMSSCRTGRDEFCKAHNVDLTKMYTVRYFLQITKKAYGGNVIKLIEEKYENIKE